MPSTPPRLAANVTSVCYSRIAWRRSDSKFLIDIRPRHTAGSVMSHGQRPAARPRNVPNVDIIACTDIVSESKSLW